MPAGRTKVKIDVEQLEKCAEKQWSLEEIAAFFRCSTKTLERNFVGIIEEAKKRGRTKLRDLQWQRALAGSDRMIEHMSKHYLGQHERNKVDITQIPDEILAPEIARRNGSDTDKT